MEIEKSLGATVAMMNQMQRSSTDALGRYLSDIAHCTAPY